MALILDFSAQAAHAAIPKHYTPKRYAWVDEQPRHFHGKSPLPQHDTDDRNDKLSSLWLHV